MSLRRLFSHSADVTSDLLVRFRGMLERRRDLEKVFVICGNLVMQCLFVRDLNVYILSLVFLKPDFESAMRGKLNWQTVLKFSNG